MTVRNQKGFFYGSYIRGFYLGGLYKGFSRGVYSHTVHHTEDTPHTERQTDQCVTVDKVAHTVHTEE